MFARLPASVIEFSSTIVTGLAEPFACAIAASRLCSSVTPMMALLPLALSPTELASLRVKLVVKSDADGVGGVKTRCCNSEVMAVAVPDNV